MRLAWFSPFPPTRSGIAAYSAELVPVLQRDNVIDPYPESAAHDFVWRHRRSPYDLVVYQLGNARCHDYMWAYLARYPGVVVLHDARLHLARARQLLQSGRAEDYRRECVYDRPDARAEFCEYAAAGLGGTIYYFWRMLRVVMHTARLVVLHNPLVADELRVEYPQARIATIRMGVPPCTAADTVRRNVRRRAGLPENAIVFAVFGKLTAEKRIQPILAAMAALAGERRDIYLLLVGDADDYTSLEQQLDQHGIADRIRVAGYVADERVGEYLAAADVCLCLRWPTAQESSASWLRCLAARKATVLTDLSHLVDIPTTVALRVDVVDEQRTLVDAMRSLADSAALREAVANSGYEYWTANHTLTRMADDYRAMLRSAASVPAPAADLPIHVTADHSQVAGAIVDAFGLSVDILQQEVSGDGGFSRRPPDF